MAELRHVPRAVIREFSTRRAQVVEELARGGQGGFYAAQVAALETRERKEHVDLTGLREDWRARAAEHGLGARELAGAARPRLATRSRRATSCCAIAGRMLGPQGLTEKQTAFSDPEAVMAWAQAHRSGATAERVRRLAARLIRTDGVEAVGEASEPGPAGPLLDDRARRRRARGARARRARPRRRSALDHRAAARRDRASRQARALGRAGGDGSRSRDESQAASSASSGSRAPERRPRPTPSRQVFAQAGIEVLGAAPSGVAAEKLQDETGISATTLHRLLDDARASGGLPRRLRPRRRRGRHGRDARPRARARAGRAGEREGDPDRRPAPASRGRGGRAVRRDRRAGRRRRPDREPPAARRARARRARACPRRSRPRLPRLRREARATRRLRKPGHHPSATARRLVGAGPRRPRRQRHARPPPQRRRRPEPARPRRSWTPTAGSARTAS